jgi:hypothetical protein
VIELMLVTTVPATDANRALVGFANGCRLTPTSAGAIKRLSGDSSSGCPHQLSFLAALREPTVWLLAKTPPAAKRKLNLLSGVGRNPFRCCRLEIDLAEATFVWTYQ